MCQNSFFLLLIVIMVTVFMQGQEQKGQIIKNVIRNWFKILNRNNFIEKLKNEK